MRIGQCQTDSFPNSECFPERGGDHFWLRGISYFNDQVTVNGPRGSKTVRNAAAFILGGTVIGGERGAIVGVTVAMPCHLSNITTTLISATFSGTWHAEKHLCYARLPLSSGVGQYPVLASPQAPSGEQRHQGHLRPPHDLNHDRSISMHTVPYI